MKHRKQKSLFCRPFLCKRRYTCLRLGTFLVLLFATENTCLHATTYTVTSLNDSGPNTLRSFMLIAATGDTIDFDPSIQGGTITLLSSLPTIANGITIEGGTGITIDEATLYVAFDVTTSGTAILSNMLISSPKNPIDTQVAAGSTFQITSDSELANLDTYGTTSLTEGSSLDGTVTIESTGSLTTMFGSITATTPITVDGIFHNTVSSITGSVNVNGTGSTNLGNTPVSGTVTVASGGILNTGGTATSLGNLTTSGTTDMGDSSSVTGATTVLAGTLVVNNSELNTLDTTGTTTLENSAKVTGAATVEIGGTLTATSSSLGSALTDNGTATLTSTPVTGPVNVGSTGTFTVNNSILSSSLTTSGTSNLNDSSLVRGATTVPAGTLTVDNSTLFTLDATGTVILQDGASVTGAATIEVGGTLTATDSFFISTLTDNGSATLTNTAVTRSVTVGSTGTFTGSGSETSMRNLTTSGTSNLNNQASVIDATKVLAGTLTVDDATLNTLDTFGTTMLQDGASVTGAATVEIGGNLTAVNSFLDNTLTDNGFARLTNTPVTGSVVVGQTGTFIGSGSGTILSTLTTSGTSTLQNNARVSGALTVLAGMTGLQNGASVLGPTTVSAGGTLSVNASTLSTLDTFGTTMLSNGGTLASAIIEHSGTLSGIGTVLGTINNLGTFAPGINGAGTLSSGNLIQQSNGTFESVVTPTTAGLSSSTTTAQLNGELFVDFLPGSYNTFQKYTIIQAAGVSGTFSSFAFSTPSLFQITYFPTHVDIQVVPFSFTQLTGNARAAAECFLSMPTVITGSTNTTDRQTVIESLIFQTPALQNFFNQVQPSQYSALTWVQITNILNLQRSLFHHGSLGTQRRDLENLPCGYPCGDMDYMAMPEENSWFEDRLGDRLGDRPEEFYCTMRPRRRRNLAPHSWQGWFDVIGNWQQHSAANHQLGFHDSSGSVSFGVDGNYDTLFLGLAGSYQTDHLNWEKGAGGSTMRTGYAGGYAMFANSHFFADLSCLIGYTTYHAHRKIHTCSIRRTSFSKFNSWEGVVGMGIGTRRTIVYGIKWVPYARVDYARLSQKTFTEHHAKSLNLHLSPYNTSLLQVETGVWFERVCCYENGPFTGLFTPKINLSYIGQFPIEQNCLRARFQSVPSCHFSVKGWDFRRNLFSPTLACTFFHAGSKFALEFGYTAQVGRNYWSNQGYIEMNWAF